MRSLSFTEFRKKASEILTLVEKGETVRVLRHGKAIAKIIPAETEQKRLSWKRPGLRLVRPGASLRKANPEERRKSRLIFSSILRRWLNDTSKRKEVIDFRRSSLLHQHW